MKRNYLFLLLVGTIFLSGCRESSTPTVIVSPPTVTATSDLVITSTPAHTVESPTSTPDIIVVSPTSLPPSTAITYTVQEGDTLFGIALNFGVTVNDIRFVNGLQNDTIYIAQTLQIPTGIIITTPTISDTLTNWQPSVLEGNLQQFYSRSIETERFTAHVAPGSYADTNSQVAVDMIMCCFRRKWKKASYELV